MKVVKNIEPFLPVSMDAVIENSRNTIASKVICATEHADVRFFSYAKGESISKEIQEEDSILIVYRGKLQIVYHEKEELILSQGELVVVPADVPYGIEVLEDSKSLNVLVK